MIGNGIAVSTFLYHDVVKPAAIDRTGRLSICERHFHVRNTARSIRRGDRHERVSPACHIHQRAGELAVAAADFQDRFAGQEMHQMAEDVCALPDLPFGRDRVQFRLR